MLTSGGISQEVFDTKHGDVVFLDDCKIHFIFQRVIGVVKKGPIRAMIIVWAKTGVAWMERSLRSVIQVLLAERMIMASDQ